MPAGTSAESAADRWGRSQYKKCHEIGLTAKALFVVDQFFSYPIGETLLDSDIKVIFSFPNTIFLKKYFKILKKGFGKKSDFQ